MARHDDQRHIRDWLKALGALSATGMTSEEAAGRINALAPILATEFQPRAFCPASLAAVARASKYFPNYAELCEALGAWVRANQPVQPVDVPRIGRDRESEQDRQAREEREIHESWRGITAEQVRAKIREVGRTDVRGPPWGKILAGLIRRHAPEHLKLLPPQWLVLEEAPRAANDSEPLQDRPPGA